MTSLQFIKLVTFDATNTLLKFRVPAWEYYAIVARDHGFKGSADDVKHRFLKSYKFMWNKHPNFGKNSIHWVNWWKQVVKMTFDGHLPKQANIDGIAEILINEFKTPKCWCIAEGCSRLINLFHNERIPIGVISNFDPRLHEILQNTGLNNYFSFILTSYDTGFIKPDEKIFKCAIEKCFDPVQPSQCLHIGDDVKKDYEGARAAGWHAIVISKAVNSERPPASGHVFSSLEELCSTIQQNGLQLKTVV